MRSTTTTASKAPRATTKKAEMVAKAKMEVKVQAAKDVADHNRHEFYVWFSAILVVIALYTLVHIDWGIAMMAPALHDALSGIRR